MKEIKNVGVIGLGKLGLPLALVLADAGFKVQGVDQSESLIDNIQIKNFRSPEPDVEKLLEKNFESISFSTSYEILKDTLIAYVIVPTPSGKTVSARKIAKSVGLDSRIGNKYLNPGLGYGGPCFPRDNKALQVFATSIGVEANLAAATDEINNRQPANMAKKIKEHYPDVETICIAGLSYKMYSNVTEASQGILLANELSRLGYIVTGFDQILSERPGKLDADIRFINDVKDLERYDLIFDSLNISSLVSLGDYSEELLLVN